MYRQAALFDPAPTTARPRADQILDAFVVFHENNPDVWDLFQRFALQAINAGSNHHSAHAIIHRIRWEVEIETKSADDLKINNNHFPYYARLFHLAFPSHDGFFRNRKLTSEDISASENDAKVFTTGAPGPEERITAKLTMMLKTMEIDNAPA